MKELNCATCGVVMYLPEETHRRRKEDGEGFYCVNGHANVFSPSEVERLKKQVEYWSRKNDELWGEIKSLGHVINGYKGQLAKVKKKIKALEDAQNARMEAKIL